MRGQQDDRPNRTDRPTNWNDRTDRADLVVEQLERGRERREQHRGLRDGRVVESLLRPRLAERPEVEAELFLREREQRAHARHALVRRQHPDLTCVSPECVTGSYINTRGR